MNDASNFDICSKCKDLVEESYKLKKTCTETDQFIRTQMDQLKITDKVNLNSIVKISGDSNSETASNENVCRICLKNKEDNYKSIITAKTDDLFSTALEACLSELVRNT